MRKIDLLNARESMQENLRVAMEGLPDAAVSHACQVIVDGFTPLLQKKIAVKKGILVAQVGGQGYRVKRTTNFLDLPVGTSITKEQAQTFIDDGVVVSVMQNT